MFAALAPDYSLEFARAVTAGLRRSQKTIPASWLYDDLGSALFEAITLLPEYGLTRADARLLGNCSHELIASAGRPSLVIELGSGSGVKTRHILAAASEQSRLRYVPIDISRAALKACEQTLSDMENVRIEPISGTYFEGLAQALSERRGNEHAIVLFLGSTIGNFTPLERGAFLKRLRQSLRPGDSLLIGTDLVKSPDILLSAYDDALGVTAAFNRNLLVRINRELGGHFDISVFAHEARFNERQSRIEMHLRSTCNQHVRVDALNLRASFSEGETIWTESCHKFTADQVRQLGTRAGFKTAGQWIDRSWGFAETLLTA